MTTGHQVVIDRKACRGSRLCVRSSPECFALDDQRKARFTGAGDEDVAALERVANECPTFAIRVERTAD